jgi:hypothetical protein
MRENHPDLSPGAQMFVKQVRTGSIIFELLPYAPNLLLGPDVVSTLMPSTPLLSLFMNMEKNFKSI